MIILDTLTEGLPCPAIYMFVRPVANIKTVSPLQDGELSFSRYPLFENFAFQVLYSLMSVQDLACQAYETHIAYCTAFEGVYEKMLELNSENKQGFDEKLLGTYSSWKIGGGFLCFKGATTPPPPRYYRGLASKNHAKPRKKGSKASSKKDCTSDDRAYLHATGINRTQNAKLSVRNDDCRKTISQRNFHP